LTATPRLIDIHCHFVPQGFPGAPAGAAQQGPCLRHREDGTATLMMGDKPFRKLDNRSWDVERRLSDMDDDGVSIQGLSPMPELLSYWLEATATQTLCRYVNASTAEIVTRRPDRFWGLGAVALQDMDRAVGALPQLKADGFSGIEVGSNVNGRYLGEPDFEPLFTAASDLGLAVFIHALHPLQAPHLAAYPDLIPFAGFVTDTGLCAATLIMSGVLERHPSLKLGLSHGGGVLGPIIHRLQQGWHTTGGFSGKLALSPRDSAARFYLDSLVYDPGYARYLTTLSPGRICLGPDYPYMIEQKKPAEFVAAVAQSDSDPLWSRAAEQFLGHGVSSTHRASTRLNT
jgi:aminocarboxymuconate-semialdehyde decarboxylase